MESEQVEVPNVFDTEGKPLIEDRLISEAAPLEYYYWGDILWGWARNWADVPWVAFKNYLTKDEVEKRFGKYAAENITLKKQKMQTSDDAPQDGDTESAWMKAEIWEIWNKKDKTVHWIALGYDKQLEQKDDPLKLTGFFPIPPLFIANQTTSLYIPTADYTLAQNLYQEVDVLQTRIAILTEAVKAVGVYDSAAEGVTRMFKEGTDNELIPIENWALFGEKGGLRGVVDWLPIQDIVIALEKLIMLRDGTIGLLQQVTGLADVMRGNLDNQYEGVGQSQIKAQFGSVRIQALQDEFAQFAGDLFQLKAEVISRHFSPETIFKQANMEASPDVHLAQQAIELIKQPEEARIRVSVRPESVAMADMGKLKNERIEFLGAMSNFLQSAAPIMEQEPGSKPFLLQMLQWSMAAFKASSEIEGVLDKLIEASQNEEQEQKPDPEAQKAQAELSKIQAKAQADQQLREQDRQADIETAQAIHQFKMIELQAASAVKMAEIQAKAQADAMLEQIQSKINVEQAVQTAGAESQKDQIEAQLEASKMVTQTMLKMKEIQANSAAKIAEAKARPNPAKKEK